MSKWPFCFAQGSVGGMLKQKWLPYGYKYCTDYNSVFNQLYLHFLRFWFKHILFAVHYSKKDWLWLNCDKTLFEGDHQRWRFGRFIPLLYLHQINHKWSNEDRSYSMFVFRVSYWKVFGKARSSVKYSRKYSPLSHTCTYLRSRKTYYSHFLYCLGLL
jgi:hypothetical protein